MDKWDYIRLISQRGDLDGRNGGVLDLLQWCDKKGTCDVTLAEAKEFWAAYKPKPPVTPDPARTSD